MNLHDFTINRVELNYDKTTIVDFFGYDINKSAGRIQFLDVKLFECKLDNGYSMGATIIVDIEDEVLPDGTVLYRINQSIGPSYTIICREARSWLDIQ